MGSSAGQSGRRFSTAAAASSSPCAQARLRALRYGRGLAWAESGVAGPHIRAYSTVEEHQAEIDAINDKFAEARDEIDYANEDAESTYFDESYKAAETVTNEVLERYRALCDKLSDAERGKLQRSMGMKMEQLKAEFKLLDTLHD